MLLANRWAISRIGSWGGREGVASGVEAGGLLAEGSLITVVLSGFFNNFLVPTYPIAIYLS